jgi:hypothetical protein
MTPKPEIKPQIKAISVHVRMTPSEYTEAQKKAQRHEVSLSQLMRAGVKALPMPRK